MKFLRVKQGRKKRKLLPFKHIAPNMVTSGNLLCGMFSLMLTFDGRFVPAAWLIFFAVFFDGLDGKMARSLGGGSQFGLEYDSLADLVSFGVAPAMMIYVASLRELGGVLGAMAACFFVLCVALRLARFNVVHVPGPFQGLPSPAGGLFVASFVLAKMLFFPVMMAAILVFTGLLMVSSISYANLKKLNRESADKKKCFVVLVLVSLCFLLLKGTAPLVLFSLYIVSGFLRFNGEKWLLRADDPAEEHVR
jgi:CDP-diacylglycerol--serine O-phosphatidyltransferase